MDGLPSASDVDTSPDKTQVSFRISHPLKKIVRRVQGVSDHTSVKRAMEVMIEEKAYEVSSMVSGIGPCVEFVKSTEARLDISKDFETFEHKSGVAKFGQLEHVEVVDIRQEKLGSISEASANIGASSSVIIRMALIGGLYDIMTEGGLDIKQRDLIQVSDKWNRITAWINTTYRDAATFFEVNFVDQYEFLNDYYNRFPGKANMMALAYDEVFYQTSGYEKIQEITGGDPLENAEELIDEHTDIELTED